MLKCSKCDESRNPYSGFEMLLISKPNETPCGKCYYSKSLKFRLTFFLWKLKQMVSGCSWVGNLNVWIFQWLFFRIAYGERVKIVPSRILPIKPSSDSYKYKLRKFSIMFPILPLTGWWNDYKPIEHYTVKFYKEPPKPYQRIDNSDLNDLLKQAMKITKGEQ